MQQKWQNKKESIDFSKKEGLDETSLFFFPKVFCNVLIFAFLKRQIFCSKLMSTEHYLQIPRLLKIFWPLTVHLISLNLVTFDKILDTEKINTHNIVVFYL